MAAKFSKHIGHLVPILLFVGFTFAFYYISPAGIIGFIGVENAYALIFILALLGGFTTFSGIPYHLVLIALALGGLNPFLLGATAAVGVMLGDSTSYYLGYHGRSLMPQIVQNMLQRISVIQHTHPNFLPVLFFLYGTFVPFSNDIITIPTGFLHFPFLRVIIPLGLGNVIFNISLALLAAYAYGFLQTVPFLSF